MRKLWAMILKDIRLLVNDRMALVINLLIPFAVSLIVGMAFGSSGSSDISLSDIGVIIVNEDAGTTIPTGDTVNLGDQLTAFFTAPPNETLDQLFNGAEGQDWEEARRMVEEGAAVAAIRIPADFSNQATVQQQGLGVTLGQGTIDLYYNSGAPISSTVVESVLTDWMYRISTGSIAAEVGIMEAVRQLSLQGIQVIGELTANLEAAYTATPVTLVAEDVGGEVQEISILGLVAPGLALFFLLFGTTFGAGELLNERQQWTLQRMITTPTPRAMILAGKMASTFVIGVLQLLILLVATSLVGANWGDDRLAVLLLILASVTGATGLGVLIASLVKEPEQLSSYGVAVLMVMGVLGGTFFFGSTDFLGGARFLSMLTINYWGKEGFTTLVFGGGLSDIALNLAVLLLMGVVFFMIGVWRFSRRLNA